MRKHFIIVFLLLTFKMPAQKKQDITYEISIIIPEQCAVSFDNESKVFVVSDDDYTCKVKFLPFNDGFNSLDSDWQNKRKLDTLFFKDLRNVALISKEKNKLFDFGKNYMKKTYYDGEVYNVTYATHTTEGMYLYRFTTKKESSLPVFDEMIGSIDYYRGNLLRRTQYAFSMSPIVFVLMLLMSIPCALIHREGKFIKNLMNGIAIFAVGAGIICWGFEWDIGLMTGPLILMFLVSACCTVIGFYISVGP